jgi:cullin-4
VKTREFLKDFAGTRSASSLKEYIKACEKLIQDERVRFLQYNLESTTQKQMMEIVHQVLIHDYTDKLLNEGSLTELLREHDVASLKALYDLLHLAGIESKLRVPWASYVMSTAKGIIGDKERGDQMTVRLLTLRRGLDVIIRDAFLKSNELKEGMRGAFGSAMNDKATASCWSTGTSKVAEMIAKHFDLLLRGGLKAIPKELLSDIQDRAVAEKEGLASSADEDAELDRQLNQTLELCRHVHGKDTFEAFYKKDLARRLLMGRSASSDAERNMITKLRDEAGSSLTQNIETMFKDQELAKEEMDAFREWDRNTLGKPSDLLHVMVLSSGAWPTYPDVNLNLPDNVASQHERFDKFYQHKHSGRVLTWKHCLGHVTLTANFPKGRKELFVSAFQASVLLLFNTVPNDGFLSYDEIKTGTNLQDADLDRTLQSLACGKARVLTKHPKGKDVKPTDTFTYNKSFTDPKVRVKINQIQLKETKEENKAMHDRIAQDRRFETQAAIVRIMKSRKQLGHAELVAEVIAMTSKRGSVEPPEIKKEIEK